MKYFQSNQWFLVIYIILSSHHSEWKHDKRIRNPSPLIIMWKLYKPSADWNVIGYFLWNFLFVSQKFNIISWETFSFRVWISQDIAKMWGSEFLGFNTVRSNISPCFIFVVDEVWRWRYSIGSIWMDAPRSFCGRCHWRRSWSILPAAVCLCM